MAELKVKMSDSLHRSFKVMCSKRGKTMQAMAFQMLRQVVEAESRKERDEWCRAAEIRDRSWPPLTDAVPAGPAAAPAAPPRRMIDCLQCGESIPMEDLVCPVCGQDPAEAPADQEVM